MSAQSEASLTPSQREFLRKIRNAKGVVRFNLRGKRPLTTLAKRGFITLEMEGEPCTKRGLRFYYLASEK